MQTPQPNTTSPLPAFYGELTERFHKEPVTKIAKSMGISYKKLWYHANKLGLRKERPNGYKSHARKLVMESFHDHSLTELAKIAGVSHTTVVTIIRELGLRHTPAEIRAIRSRRRKEVIEKERLLVNWGLPQKTKLKVYTNHEKTALRWTMKKLGYIVDEDDKDTLYYTEDLKRHIKREENGRKMGLRFEPLPEDYWDEDYDEEEDIDDDDYDEDYDDDENFCI